MTAFILPLTDLERRILAALLDRSQSRRHLVHDLASPESKIGRNRDIGTGLGGGGSNHAESMIFARWCRRLIPAKLVEAVYDGRGFYQFHRITRAGIDALALDAQRTS